MAAVISGLADKDPARAFDLASEIASPMEQTQALQSVVNMAILRDPASMGPLLERVLAMPNSAQRQTLVQMAVNSLASSDPGKAAEWLIANPGQSPDVVAQVASAVRADRSRARGVVLVAIDRRRARRVGARRRGRLRAGRFARRARVGRAAARHSRVRRDGVRGPPIGDAAGSRGRSAPHRFDQPRGLPAKWNPVRSQCAGRIPIRPLRRIGPRICAIPRQRTFAVQAVGSTWAQQNAPAAKEWVSVAAVRSRARRRAFVNHVGHRAFRCARRFAACRHQHGSGPRLRRPDGRDDDGATRCRRRARIRRKQRYQSPGP